ncbi:centromere-associated protein E [Thamnophis elegans]|uniref:centromere-associated protein E n=1 Tax=Thamnophis elegans TaxID=35005 RepID=UPI00137847DB|nr:centromere-associated protein E [Thamnophis elegans]
MMEEGGVTVCVRVRPLIAREKEDLDEKGQVSWKSEDCTVSQTDGTRSFVFDRVFHSNNSTKEVYQGVAAPIIKSAVQGYNGTIFAYGQTASGKTYTILGTKDGPGILAMAINDVFNTICRIPDREFLLRISYMEIHNETIQDLLCSNNRKKKSLVVREDINRNIYVEDLNEEVVVSPEEVISWLKKGEKNRHYGETKMNERSSRSHTIFRMIIESKEKYTSGSSYEGAVMVSHLNFVDLAGSERASQTGAEGIRLKEGCNINRSLFILGQVIKKLCDDQSGGFINYRDSKLTRILQNSLGGNAKTVIICTITPASLEETLSTLQFASTAKKMKNTPKVNEVLDDDALLKRYRNEIEELKRQLEEVSSYSQTKDQLAQLLEEKNSVQNEQQDRIRALTEMLVTSSSFLRERERKDKKKRRVTWAPGALSQDGGIPFLEDIPGRAKRFKSSLPCVTEMEECKFFSSVSSDVSDYEDPPSVMPEEEWIPGSKISFDNAVTEQQTIKAKFDSVCLEKEQLTYELTELHEKISTHEFMALEKQASEEQECFITALLFASLAPQMQLMHEITNLKAIISNAEIYNQDLQVSWWQEINSKDMQCKKQEERITALEEHNKKLKSLVEEFKKDKNDSTILVQTPRKNRDEVQELKQSLRDAEAVALDAKKESAFLQSENVTLKEKMNQLSDTCNQIEKDLGSYKTQLERGKANYKKMQSDLQKELQYYMQENAKLTSLVEVNNSKDLLPYMELEGKMEDLKNQLNKALDENVDLKEKLAGLSEVNCGSDLEILHKEIVEKNDTIALLMSEKEMLWSQVAEKERKLNEATQALASKMDLANDEVIRGHTVAFEELRQPCDKLEQKFLDVAEEDKSMKTQIDSCSNGCLNTSISYNTQEQSTKKEELEEKGLEQEELLTLKKQLDEAHEKLSEMEELKDQLKAWESKMEAEEAQKSDMMERLQEDKEKIRALTQERNDFKQKQEALEKERDQLKEDIQDTVSMQSTKKEELEEKGLEQEELLTLKKQLDEAHEKLSEMEELKDQLKAWESKMEAEEAQMSDMMERLQEDKEKIRALTQERNDFKQKQEALEKERDQLKEVIQDTLSMQSTKKEELEEKDLEQEELLTLKKQLDEAHEKLSEMEELKDQLKAWESKMEAEEAQKSDMIERLQEDKEKIRALTQERNDFKQKQEALEKERDQLKEVIQDTVSMSKQSTKKEELEEDGLKQEELLTLKKQLDEAHEKLSEMEELKDQLKAWESKMEAEEAQKSDMMERLQEDKEKIRALTQERNDFKQKQEALEKERDQLKEDIQDTISMNIEAQEGFMSAQNSLKQCQKCIKELKETIAEKDKQISRVKETLEITIDDQKQQILQILQILKLTDDLKDISVNQIQNEDVNNELQWIKEQIATLQQEKVALQHQLEDLEKEKNQYLESYQVLQTKSVDLQQLLQTNQNAESFDDAEQLKISLESQVEVLQKENAELVQKLHSTEEDIKNIGQEKEHLRIEVEVLRAEKDTMTQTVYHLGETLEKLVPMNLELQEQLNEANNSLREHKEMVEELKGKTIATDSQTSKIDEELKQKAEDTQLELEKLLAYVKLQEDEVNTQKNLVLEKQQMFQRLEEEFKRRNKKTKEKLQYLENNSLELRQLLCLKKEESQQNVEKTKDDEQLSISESQMEALQREKNELVQTLQSSEENVKYLSQEKENLRTEIEVLQAEKDNMIQTVHRLSETIERLVPVNLELQQELREANNSLREHKEMVEELKEKIVTTDFQTLKVHEELKKKSEHSQLELDKLLIYVKSQEDEGKYQKNLVLEQQQMFQKLEEEIKEETKHLQEKIIKSNEEVRGLTEEKKQLTAELREQEKCVQQLLKEKTLLQKERDDLQQVTENIKEEIQSQLQETSSENAAKIIKLNKEASSLNEEKKQLTAELREQEKCIQQLLKEKALLQKERDDLQQVMENIREETQSQFQETLSENAAKIIKLNKEASSLNEEKKQLTAELREQEKCVQQLLKEKALLQKERDDLQQVTENIKEETQSQLQETFSQNAGKESEMSVQRKMQDCFEILEAKIFRIMEAPKKFPELEKRSEYFIKISLQIKNLYDSKKALITKGLPDISRQEANNIKRLQIENERISNSLYSLLNKLQYFFACLCDKRKEYYTNVSQYTRELLDERRNQHALLMQMQQLGKPHLEQQGDASQQFGVSGLIQSLDGLTEQISKEVSEMEEELGSTEVMLQELERENVEMEQYLERCSNHFDLQGFKATIKQNTEKFRSINQFLQPKAEPYFQARSAVEAINTNYCKEIDATLKACKEETKELILQLDVLKKGQKSCSVLNMAVKEENHNLGCNLKATEQDTKNLQLKIQDLESIINEERKNLQEKEKTIAILEMKLKVRGSRSEVIKLQAALEEKENCLRNALSERETLKAQVDKGVGLYKEKIEDLTTQLAKADMARMKQSKLFDREMANAKALADHREEQLRKLKEELRKAQQEQDITVTSNKDLPQSFLPITCGGGSGIVQNTHMLVLKSEHAKLEKEYAQFKKEHDLLLSNVHHLKEEVKKWKERAMKRRERVLGDTIEEHKIKSPKKAPVSSHLALPASPCKESSMQPILPLDTPQLMPSNSQSNFFDNSCLGITANAKFGKTESEENNFKDWLSSDDRGDVSNCKTQ